MVVYNQLCAYFVEHNYFGENQYDFEIDRVKLELDKGNSFP